MFNLLSRLLNPKFAVFIGGLWILKYICGYIAGRIILPAQYIAKADSEEMLIKREQEPKTNSVNVKYVNVKTKDNSKLDTVEISHDEANIHSPHIIVINGNFFAYDAMLSYLKTMVEKNKWNVIAFDYPGVRNSKGRILSQQTLVNAGIAQVNRLLSRGVEAENITLYGMSLGGAVACLVAQYFHTQKNPKRIYIINDRSFASVGHMSKVRYGDVIGHYLIKPILYLLDWTMDAAEPFKQIPDSHKILFVAEQDTIIPYYKASLFQAIKPDLKNKLNQIEHQYKSLTKSIKVSNGHELKSLDEIHWAPLNTLKDKHGNKMSETATLFVQRKLTYNKLIEIRKEFLSKRNTLKI